MKESEILEAISDGRAESLAEQRALQESKLLMWDLSLIPTDKTKNAKVGTGIHLPDSLNTADDKARIDAAVAVLTESKVCNFEARRRGENISKFVTPDEGERLGTIGSYIKDQGSYLYVCSEFSGTDLRFLNQCRKAVTAAVKEASPFKRKYSAAVALPGVYEEVLTNYSYDKGIKLAALKMIQRYKSPQPEFQASLYGDLKSSFEESGMSTHAAEEATFRVLALISTSGPNLRTRLMAINESPAQWPKFTGLSVIASLIPALDWKFSDSGHLYSLPSTVRTFCDSGKPYHFWMAAYLSRQAAVESGSPKAGATAAFIAEKGYQVAGATETRAYGGILKNRTFSGAANIVRADLAYAAAGAIYGAHSVAGSPQAALDIDDSIRHLINDAGDHAPREKYQIEALKGGLGLGLYADWNRMFNPNETFYQQAGSLPVQLEQNSISNIKFQAEPECP